MIFHGAATNLNLFLLVCAGKGKPDYSTHLYAASTPTTTTASVSSLTGNHSTGSFADWHNRAADSFYPLLLSSALLLLLLPLDSSSCVIVIIFAIDWYSTHTHTHRILHRCYFGQWYLCDLCAILYESIIYFEVRSSNDNRLKANCRIWSTILVLLIFTAWSQCSLLCNPHQTTHLTFESSTSNLQQSK